MAIEKIKVDTNLIKKLNEKDNAEKTNENNSCISVGISSLPLSPLLENNKVALSKVTPVSIKVVNDSVIMSMPTNDTVVPEHQFIFSKREIKEMIQSIY